MTVATPAAAVPVVAAMAAEYMTLALPDLATAADGDLALERILALEADVVAVGPGLGTGPAQTRLVHGLLGSSGSPLVLDADALTIVANDVSLLRSRDGLDIVLTPHPGEMARLAGISTEEVQRDRLEVARDVCHGQQRVSGAQRAPHPGRHTRWTRVDQSNRQSRHGDGRHR